MSNKILLKKTSVSGKIPRPDDLEIGELALNMSDSILFFKDASGFIKSIKPTVQDLSAYSFSDHVHTGIYEPANINIQTHIDSTNNPHNVSKTQIGLGNVDNTSDADKPISAAIQTELNLKADKTQVLTDVPADALFTDTIYTHPTDDGSLHIPATGTNNKGKVLIAGDTPASFSWESLPAERSYLYTTSKLFIDITNRALLPRIAIGDIVWNMALIFETTTSNVIQKEVTVSTDGTYVIFDNSDDVKGMYCIISYLTYSV
jgi:hypothetical protein